MPVPIVRDHHFSEHLLRWYDRHGRKDLPWQQQPTPYHVWLSEIMLQQTQVATVIDYYHRFVARFPDIDTLAHASVDEVLALWSGLGYYARARNLHHAARIVLEQHDATLPANFDALVALPGIGRSTAGAILSLAFHQRYPILDGNVRRVLARFDAIEGWPGNKAVENRLWQRAEALLPRQRIAHYIQAQMDLGATLCTRSRPDCNRCPLRQDCKAWRLGTPTAYPGARPKKALPTRHTHWLVVMNRRQEILLLQRPTNGIWGGLWSFPECDEEQDLESYCRRHLRIEIEQHQRLAPLRHLFTHFRLDIQPHLLRCDGDAAGVTDTGSAIWYKMAAIQELGLPAPVRNFLQSL